MIRLGDLNPGDIVEFIDPATSQFNVGTFVRTIKRRTGDKGTDIIVLSSIGHKTTIRDQNIRWDRTAHHKEVA